MEFTLRISVPLERSDGEFDRPRCQDKTYGWTVEMQVKAAKQIEVYRDTCKL